MSEQQGAVSSLVNEPAARSRGETPVYRPLKLWSSIVVALGAVTCLVDAGGTFLRLRERALLVQLGSGSSQANADLVNATEAVDVAARLTTVLSLIGIIVTFVAGGIWIYRAACNIRAFGARRLQIRPGWAVGWYFIPYMNLIKPFTAMVEIWNASRLPDRWRTQSTPDLLRCWWGAWIVSSLSGIFIVFATMAGQSVPALIMLMQAMIVSLALRIAAILLFLAVVWRVTQFQARSAVAADATHDPGV